MNKKYAQLHLHTNLSDAVSLISVDEILGMAEEWGLAAVAFTNLNNLYDFGEIAKRRKIASATKVIYGGEFFYESPHTGGIHKLTLLAKNQDGIKELYKIVSSKGQKDGVYLIDTAVLKANRKNLLVGSCGYDGELFACFTDSNEELLEKTAAFYDYFEIFPSKDKQDKEINQKIAELGSTLGVLTVAASNAHYLSPEDAVCRDIVFNTRPPKIKKRNNLCFLDLNEMLQEFSYLGDETKAVVVENPLALADLIEEVNPFKAGYFEIKWEGASEEIENLCRKRAHTLYGNPLPDAVEKRLDEELRLIKYNGFSSFYLTSYKIAKFITDKGHLIGTRGTAGSVFAAYLLGITDINPLPPHYLCPKCRYTEFALGADGLDLSAKNCPHCGTKLETHGHNIPYESFMGLRGDKLPDFDINVPSDVRLSVIDYLQTLFGKEKVALGGTVGTLLEYKAENLLEKYETEKGMRFDPEKRALIIQKLTGIKWDDGMHPGGIMVIPRDMEFEDFTPLKKDWAPIDVTHFDFHHLHDTIQKLDVLEVTALDFLETLRDMTGVFPKDTDLCNPSLYALFATGDTEGIPEFKIDFARKLLKETKPKTFSELIKILGLFHGTDVFFGNGELLLKMGIPLSLLPTTRDDIMNNLLAVGADKKDAFQMAEATRKGLMAKGRTDAAQRELFKGISAPLGEWYYNFCSKARYMFPKAHAVEYALISLRLAWFKKYYPQEFHKAYEICYEES